MIPQFIEIVWGLGTQIAHHLHLSSRISYIMISLRCKDVHIYLRYSLSSSLFDYKYSPTALLCARCLHVLDLKAPLSPFLYICNNFFCTS